MIKNFIIRLFMSLGFMPIQMALDMRNTAHEAGYRKGQSLPTCVECPECGTEIVTGTSEMRER